MLQFKVPTRNEVSENNQVIFDGLEKSLGFVPNLYAYYANNETALADYLALQNRKSTLRAKEREVINLVVSQFNQCAYCLAAHTAIGKMNGFSEEQILSIRQGEALFDAKLNALARFVQASLEGRGRVNEAIKEELFEAGYNEANLIDIAMVVGDKMISNYIHNLTAFAVDFPAAAELETV